MIKIKKINTFLYCIVYTLVFSVHRLSLSITITLNIRTFEVHVGECTISRGDFFCWGQGNALEKLGEDGIVSTCYMDTSE